MNRGVQQGAAGEAEAREQPGGEDGEREAEADGARGDDERQPDGLPFLGRKVQAIRP
jgi:hypothetical protein